VATILTPFSNKSGNCEGVSCHEICKSSVAYQAAIALYASYSLEQSNNIHLLLNNFKIFRLGFAFIA
jgi:hypothetical protein